MKLEELIQKHRPRPGTEKRPASHDQLRHLNNNALLLKALRRQLAAEGRDPTEIVDADNVVVTRIVAWQVLAEAQRAGVRLEPRRLEPDEDAR